MPPFWLAIRWNTRSCCRMPLTVTAFRSLALLTSSTADGVVVRNLKQDSTVVVGAHLDSVVAGPGINDNGSGSATIQEIAEQLAALKYTNKLQRQVTDYFDSQGLASEPTAFDGRSDYGPFIAVGIPAGGLFSGAEGVKTPEQAAIFGGTAGEPYDECYHQACDTTNNLNSQALFELGDAAAHATLTLAMSKSGIQPDGSLAARSAAKVTLSEQGPLAVR